MTRITPLFAGALLLALPRAARAEDPPPLPPPTTTAAPTPTPTAPTPYDESTFVEVTIDADAPGVWLEALTEREGYMHLRWRWHHAVVYGRGLAWERV